MHVCGHLFLTFCMVLRLTFFAVNACFACLFVESNYLETRTTSATVDSYSWEHGMLVMLNELLFN
jgi:hypothetical protein